MIKPNFKTIPPFNQLILLIIIIISTWITTSLLGTLFGFFLFGKSLLSSMELLMANPNYLKFFQVVQSIGLFILPPFIFTKLCSNSVQKELQLNRINLHLVIAAIIAVIIAQPFIKFLGVFNYNLEFPSFLDSLETWLRFKEEQAADITKLFLESDQWLQIILNICIVAILPAIGEELLFRGAIQNILNKLLKNHHWAIWITAFLFTLMHMQFFGLLPRLILGVIFGYLVVYGGSLWLAILAHFINNFMALIIYYNQSGSGIDPLDVGNQYPSIIWVIISITALIILIRWFKNHRPILQS